MATDVVMPQMGESIAEGTIVRWIKKVGDRVERDEPLFEISTDKVDAEIPSPAAGVVTEIRAKEGETVPIDTVVAVIDAAPAREQPAAKPAGAPAGEAPAATPRPVDKAAPAIKALAVEPKPAIKAPAVEPALATPNASGEAGAAPERMRSSPLVRRIAKEHDVDVAALRGSGLAGRVTKNDILSYLETRGEAQAVPGPKPSAAAAPVKPKPTPTPGTVQPMSVMRKKIAEHMVLSRRTSAHVHTVFEVDFSRVARHRETRKAEYERAGAKLTYLSFIVKAVAGALRAVPIVNASVDGENIVFHEQVNVGIAVALDWGLIVPVVKQADGKNLLGVSRAIADLAERARAKQLKPEEVGGGTFTITNPGVFGALFGMPIINQPQVAILGIGNIEKRPVVIDDAIAIRPRGYLSLGYDHRIIDGAVADEFMSHIKEMLEHWDDQCDDES